MGSLLHASSEWVETTQGVAWRRRHKNDDSMPPNARVGGSISIRSRGIVDNAVLDNVDDPSTESTLRSLKGLKGNEIAIEGNVYDIIDFVHPGGEVIKFFGGNDVTVQYKMIHPHHTGKQLEKMNMVGKVVDYVPE